MFTPDFEKYMNGDGFTFNVDSTGQNMVVRYSDPARPELANRPLVYDVPLNSAHEPQWDQAHQAPDNKKAYPSAGRNKQFFDAAVPARFEAGVKKQQADIDAAVEKDKPKVDQRGKEQTSRDTPEAYSFNGKHGANFDLGKDKLNAAGQDQASLEAEDIVKRLERGEEVHGTVFGSVDGIAHQGKSAVLRDKHGKLIHGVTEAEAARDGRSENDKAQDKLASARARNYREALHVDVTEILKAKHEEGLRDKLHLETQVVHGTERKAQVLYEVKPHAPKPITPKAGP